MSERIACTWRVQITFTTVAGDTLTATRELAYPLTSDVEIRKFAEHVAEQQDAVVLDVVEFHITSWPGKPTDHPHAPTPPPERTKLWRERGYAGPDVSMIIAPSSERLDVIRNRAKRAYAREPLSTALADVIYLLDGLHIAGEDYRLLMQYSRWLQDDREKARAVLAAAGLTYDPAVVHTSNDQAT